MAASSAIPLPDAAESLGISESTLKRKIDQGAPVAHRGRRGRGNRTLVDPDEIRHWLDASPGERDLIELRSQLPELFAAAIDDAYRLTPHKRPDIAWSLLVAWQLIVEVLDLDIDVDTLPDAVVRLRKLITKTVHEMTDFQDPAYGDDTFDPLSPEPDE